MIQTSTILLIRRLQKRARTETPGKMWRGIISMKEWPMPCAAGWQPCATEIVPARAAVRMRTLLLAALERDKHLADAYAGLGLYDYFVDTLPTIIKMLRWIIGMPGGNRERGLQEIEYAAKYGELTRGEALFYLAKDYSRSNERQYAKSLELFEQLRKQYPRNGLWALMVGSLEIRTGRVSEGEALYREVLDQTRGEQTETAVALHKAALKALKARHPGERFE